MHRRSKFRIIRCRPESYRIPNPETMTRSNSLTLSSLLKSSHTLHDLQYHFVGWAIETETQPSDPILPSPDCNIFRVGWLPGCLAKRREADARARQADSEYVHRSKKYQRSCCGSPQSTCLHSACLLLRHRADNICMETATSEVSAIDLLPNSLYYHCVSGRILALLLCPD